MNQAKAIGRRNGRWAGGVGMAVGAACAAALIGLANAPMAGADEGGALDTAVDNFLQGIANSFAPEFNESGFGDPDAFCLTFFTCTDDDQMIDSLYQAVNTDFQPEGPIDNFFDQLLGTAPAATMDMQISIDGTDLFPTAGNTATASSGMGDIAIAIGTLSSATASGGIFDSAFADGNRSTAVAGLTGNFDSATANGASSFAEAGAGNFDTATATGSSDAFAIHGDGDLASAVDTGSAVDVAFAGSGSPTVLGSFDIASVLGTGSSADAGTLVITTPGDFDLAAAFGDMLHAIAGGNFMTDILP